MGAGPALARIRARFPKVNYLGLLDREELAKVYASADVFVFPSKTDTFGLVLLEAMACGLPVAAYPVTGPRDVIGDSSAGVLHDDLRTACLGALQAQPRRRAGARRECSPGGRRPNSSSATCSRASACDGGGVRRDSPAQTISCAGALNRADACAD